MKKLLFMFLTLGVLCMLLFESYRLGVRSVGDDKFRVSDHHRYFRYSTSLPNGMKYLGRGDSNLDLLLLEQGYYEPLTIEVLHRIAEYFSAEERAGESLVFLDIGANVGVHSLAMATEVDRIIAVEPYPPVLERLKEHIRINGLEEKVEVLNVGFAQEKARLKFAKPPASDIGIGTFSKDVFDNHRKFTEYHHSSYDASQLFFEVVPGDSVVSGKGVDIIKIDIEGYERYALIGLKKVLETDQPVVVMELNTNKDGGFSKEAQLYETFPAGYSFLYINTKPSQPCVAPLKFPEGSVAQTIAIPKKWEALRAMLAHKQCGGFFSEFLYPYIHEIRDESLFLAPYE